MDDSYKKLVLKALSEDALVYQGVRKIISGLTWETPTVPPFTFESLGYGKNKLKQLIRNYIDEEEFKRVRTILEKRKDQSFTSVAVSLRGAKKESRSMGWCMLSLVISRTRNREIVEVQYRSTELILKFGGDLAFMPWLFENLGLNPEFVRFRFANCYLSGVYFPYICSWWDPIHFLSKVKVYDPTLFQNGTRFFLRSSYKQDQVFPYSPENVAHKFGWANIPRRTMRHINGWLEAQHKAYGKPLPKTHYKEGEYIPRGQRK